MNAAIVRFLRAARLVCPRCGVGRLFTGWFAMAEACSHCGLDFRREPGFYLGSIYINYGITALGTGGLYLLLVYGLGLSHEQALAACLAVAMLFPVWFFRYARSFLLAIDSSVNREQPEWLDAGAPPPGGLAISNEQLAAHRSADASAGCFMGVALALVLLFGLAMAVATLFFAIGSGSSLLAAEPARPADLLPTVGSIERLDPRLDVLVPRDAPIEVLASGFEWAEGPVWIADDRGGLPPGSLLFSDIPRNRVYRWHPRDGLGVFLEPSGFTGPSAYGTERGSNGLTLDREGRLISCEHGDRRVSRLEPGGGKRTLADAWEGKRFNSPNDAVVHSSGAIYFTDPPYGLPRQMDDPRREIGFCGIYRLGPDGTVALLCRSMTRPNGLAFSPDEKLLYVAQSDPKAPLWMAFAVAADGTLDQGRVFFDATRLAETRKGLPDGLKVDPAGNLFATGPGGVLIIAADGTHLGTILTGQATANCAFGEGGRTLFITADSLLCRVRLGGTAAAQ
jgi:gluconolactonase